MQHDHIKVDSKQLLKKVKELVHQGNIRKLIIKDSSGKTYMEIPLTVGVVGVLFAPLWAAVGALAALSTNFTIQVVKKEDPSSVVKKDDES